MQSVLFGVPTLPVPTLLGESAMDDGGFPPRLLAARPPRGEG